MMILTGKSANQMVIDLDDTHVVLILGTEMGLYFVTGTLSITWNEMLNSYLTKKLGKQ